MMEQRIYPRINVSFPIKITPDIVSEAVDISEGGFSFILQKPLLLSKANVKIDFSEKESIETEFRVIWNKQLIEKNGFKYGACLIRLKNKDINVLRDILIRKHMEPLLEEIEDSSKRQKVLDFWMKDCKKYMEQCESLSQDIENKRISLTDACQRLKIITDHMLQRGDEIEILLDNKKIIKKIKQTFRILCGIWPYKSKIVKRGFEKPRGYPGDYLMIESVYDNKNISDGIGYCADNYFLNNEYPTAVRNRKNKMKDILIDYIYKKPSQDMDILNVGCGSCREIVEVLLSGIKPIKKVNFSLVDQDEEALLFSKKALELTKSGYCTYRFLQHNILDYIRHEQKYLDILGKQDLAYSIGVTDYLPDRMLKKLISFCLKLLKPKGTLILAHKDKVVYKPIASDWWCDWTFFPRDEKEFLNMLSECEINGFDLKTEREKSNIVMFFILTKK